MYIFLNQIGFYPLDATLIFNFFYQQGKIQDLQDWCFCKVCNDPK